MNILNFRDFLTEAASSTLYAIGATGEEVKKIQQKLIDLGFLKISEPTGNYQEQTKKAVEDFQRSKGLTGKDVDGIVGQKTYPLLMGSTGKVSLPSDLGAISSDSTGVGKDLRGFKSMPPADLSKKLVGDTYAINPKASLLFNGEELQWIVDGNPVKSWKAISGITWKNTPITQWVDTLKRYTIDPAKWSKDKDAGPLPPGKYSIGPLQSRSKLSPPVSELVSLWNFMTGQYVSAAGGWSADSDFSKIAWGNYRAPISSKPGTNTYGRGSFYVHGGAIPGSHGCIDLTDQMDDFGKYYGTWLASTGKSQIDLSVMYKSDNENSFFSKIWGDQSLFAYDQTSSQNPGEFTA